MHRGGNRDRTPSVWAVSARSDILRHVWGYESGGSNVIEANVWSLRKKLGDRASAIETVRGLGYRFRTPDQGVASVGAPP